MRLAGSDRLRNNIEHRKSTGTTRLCQIFSINEGLFTPINSRDNSAERENIMAVKSIPIKDICLDAGTQQRPVDEDVMKKYAALMRDGAKFPPVSIVTDGKNNYLWDGAHRVRAALRNNDKYISANIENGSRRDAIYFSFSANKTNAFPRQPGTVKKIIEKILKDDEWAEMSQRGIADWVGCTQGFVSKIQAGLKKQTEDKKQADTKSYSIPSNTIESPLSEPEEGLARAKTVKVKRNGSEYDYTVPEKKVLDSTGKQVPEHLVKYFERANEYRQMIRELNGMLKTVREGKETGDLFYRFIKIHKWTMMPWASIIICRKNTYIQDSITIIF